MTYTDAMRLQVQVMTEVLQKQHFSNFTAEIDIRALPNFANVSTHTLHTFVDSCLP